MNKINCTVCNCSHNNNGVCYSNRVNIGGMAAKKDCDTCCGSFLDKANYSSLTNNTNSKGCCDCLVCEVSTCTYNNNKLCSADCVSVSGDNVKVYQETHCQTFKAK